MADWRVGADRDLPIVEQETWDGDAARAQIFELDQDDWRRGFLIYDAEQSDERGSYKLPFAIVRDGRLSASTAGLEAAASRLPQTDAPAEVLSRARGVIDHYAERAEKAADFLVFDGSQIKTLSDAGLVGGYLIRFSSARDPDLEHDYFTQSTDFDIDVGDTRSVYYEHGQDRTLGVRKLTRFTLKRVDDVGLWIEAQLQIRDEYEEFIRDQVEKGKMGWSSGAVAHLVRLEPSNYNTRHITYWPVAEATITPRPAEPRNKIIPLKSTALQELVKAQARDEEKAHQVLTRARAYLYIGVRDVRK